MKLTARERPMRRPPSELAVLVLLRIVPLGARSIRQLAQTRGSIENQRVSSGTRQPIKPSAPSSPLAKAFLVLCWNLRHFVLLGSSYLRFPWHFTCIAVLFLGSYSKIQRATGNVSTRSIDLARSQGCRSNF